MEEVDKKQEIPSTDLLNINTNNNNIENNNSNIEKANKNVFKENNENILQNRIAENLDLESVQTKKEAKITETFSCDGYDDNENLW